MNTLKGKHIVVTGGAGFAGSHLVDRLIQEEPLGITVISNFSLGKIENLKIALSRFPVVVKDLDLSDGIDVFNFFCREKVDVVFHLASIPLMKSIEEPERVFREIMDMTLNLCKAQRFGKFETLIQFSSSEVYGTAVSSPMSEQHPTHPTTPYGVAKLMSDHIALVNADIYGLDIAIVRPFNFYGPRQHSGTFGAIIPTVITRIMNGQEVYLDGDGNQTRDFTFVSDVIEATIDIYKEPKTRGLAINIGTGRRVTMKYVIAKIIELMGTGNVVSRLDRTGQVRNLEADILLAKKLIGFNPRVEFEKGLERTVEWYRNG